MLKVEWPIFFTRNGRIRRWVLVSALVGACAMTVPCAVALVITSPLRGRLSE